MSKGKTTDPGQVSAEHDPRWPAVVARDRLADGAFYYSVETTGVYCRPSCPSRPGQSEECAVPQHVDRCGASGIPALSALQA
jgi:AraC family transcriptional regulator, regulatory protein of adaptative response / methylated-DNA-[protein]-cysteine methyltransferase